MNGAILKSLRESKGLTQKELAEMVGVTPKAISFYELDQRDPSNDLLIKFSAIFNVTIDYLLNNDVVQTEINKFRGNNKVINVPVLGSIPAGIPIAAIEDIIDYEEVVVPQSTEPLDYFALKVIGDSMTPRIQNGDVVVCRKQDTADTGDIAVVLINGEDATLKRIQKSEDGLSLIPDNTAYRPRFFTNKEILTTPVKILGKVVELRGKF